MTRRLSATAFVLGLMAMRCDEVNAIRSKGEYGALQVAEDEHRGSPVHDVEVFNTKGHIIAGFPARSGGRNVWILLNPRYPPLYKRVPDIPPAVSAKALAIVRNTPGVSESVVRALAAERPSS